MTGKVDAAKVHGANRNETGAKVPAPNAHAASVLRARPSAAAGRSSPGLRYRNVEAAVDWLCKAYDFKLRSRQTDADGNVVYAELCFGSTIIMVGAVSGFDIDRYMKQPDDIGGAETQCCYYVVDDLDALYVRARRAGSEIVIDLTTRPNGARTFTCRDPEGHLWCFGTYDPYLAQGVGEAQVASQAAAPERPDARAAIAARAFGVAIPSGGLGSARAPAPDMDMEALAAAAGNGFIPVRRFPFPARLAAGLSIAAIVSGTVAAWIYADAWQTSRSAVAGPAALIGPERMIGAELGGAMFQQAIKDVRRRLALERRSRRAAENASRLARAEVRRERDLRLSAEQTAKQLAAELDAARAAAERAQSAASAAEDTLARQEQAATPAERQRLAQALQAAQQAAADARNELVQLQRAAAAADAGRAAAENAQADAERQRAQAEHAKADAERQRLQAEQAKAEAEQAKAAAERARDLAEEQRAAAQREVNEAHARLTFVSLNAKEGSAEAITKLREQMEAEKAARGAAERDARTARAELERERRLKAEAWQTVNVLRRRLAALGGAEAAQIKAPKPIAARRKQATATAAQPQQPAPAKGPAGEAGWSLYSGPQFIKAD